MKSNALTWALAAALAVALIVIAFLLGRESRPVTVGGPVARYVEPPSMPRADTVAEPPKRQVPPRDDVLITNRGGGEVRVERGAHEDGEPGDAAAVAEYFGAVDGIRAGPEATRPDAFARSLAGEISSGDASGLERLEADIGKATEQLRKITPPPVCREYHRTLLEATREGAEVLRDMTKALHGQGDLGSLAARAQKLQRYEAELKKLREKIERDVR